MNPSNRVLRFLSISGSGAGTGYRFDAFARDIVAWR